MTITWGDVVVGLVVAVGSAFILGMTVGMRRIMHMVGVINDHVVPHFAPTTDDFGREVIDHTLPERVKKIEAELSFDHGESVKDMVGKIARANGVAAPSGPEDDSVPS